MKSAMLKTCTPRFNFLGMNYIFCRKELKVSNIVNDSFLGQFVCCHWLDVFASDCKFKQPQSKSNSLVGDFNHIYVSTYVIGLEAATMIQCNVKSVGCTRPLLVFGMHILSDLICIYHMGKVEYITEFMHISVLKDPQFYLSK